ncbi:MAG: hypothetical protein AVDCRST_MAG68-3765, partial [uncultured Gemmatimonadetes bacterium]
ERVLIRQRGAGLTGRGQELLRVDRGRVRAAPGAAHRGGGRGNRHLRGAHAGADARLRLPAGGAGPEQLPRAPGALSRVAAGAGAARLLRRGDAGGERRQRGGGQRDGAHPGRRRLPAQRPPLPGAGRQASPLRPRPAADLRHAGRGVRALPPLPPPAADGPAARRRLRSPAREVREHAGRLRLVVERQGPAPPHRHGARRTHLRPLGDPLGAGPGAALEPSLRAEPARGRGSL